MNYTFEIKDVAIVDMQQAYDYYESCSVGLGDNFMNTLDEYIDLITKYPEMYQIKEAPFREAFIKTFPYLIIYEFQVNKVVIYSIFNTSRNPNSKNNYLL